VQLCIFKGIIRYQEKNTIINAVLAYLPLKIIVKKCPKKKTGTFFPLGPELPFFYFPNKLPSNEKPSFSSKKGILRIFHKVGIRFAFTGANIFN
jgi:hypothetical protein